MQNKSVNGIAFPAGSVSAKDFVLSTYNPRVAVINSVATEKIVSKNNLKFTDLITPFTSLTSEVIWHEPINGTIINPRGLRITPIDLASWKRTDVDSQKNRKILNNAVTRNIPPMLEADNSKFLLHNLARGKGSSTEYRVEAPSSTPWFESWRETFLKVHSENQTSQHDFLHHFMACMLVISSSEGKTAEELSETVAKLSKVQQQHQSEWPNTWAFPSVLKFYLILHERNSVEQGSADAMYQSLRTTYGGNFCFMLQMDGNSNNPEGLDSNIWSHLFQEELLKDSDALHMIAVANSEEDVIVKSDLFHPLSPETEKPLPFSSHNGEQQTAVPTPIPISRGKYLSTEDLKNIQTAINEFISKALLPYVDRQSRLLHESIINRRGMSKSFFSATKRLFGTTAKTASSIIYATESLEMMSRKLADVYFLFGHYAGAYQLYHQLKKDFLADSAWTYFASSLEMAAVSHFMMSQVEPPLAITRAFPVHYVGDAINYYIDNCRLIDSATKCALICCECLKQMDNYGEAAAIYIRMTSEECDLRSALMLEQAAYAFLRLNMPRKYALHCVLAGHRYSKAGFKAHSLNCYTQASQIYSGKGWRFAEDHVHFTIARQQSLLQITKDVSKYLQSLLVTPTPQPPQQIQAFYKEYLSIMAKLENNDSMPHDFFVPKVMCYDIRIRIAVCDLENGEISSNSGPDDESLINWDSLEEQVVKECVKNSVIVFKPSRMTYYAGSDNTVHPIVPCNETFYVEVPISNPLPIPISLRNIRLNVSNVKSVDSSVVPELEMQPTETKTVRFALRASTLGTLCFDWILYDLELSSMRVQFKQKIKMQGPRLNTTKSERCGRVYAKDLRSQISIVEEMPLLQACVEDIPGTLYHAQSVEFQIVLNDKSRDKEHKNRIKDIVFAMENMKDCLEIHSNASLNPDLKVESVHQNYTRFSTSFNDNSNCQIPCLFKAPQSGEFALLNVLVLYRFHSPDSGRNSKSHRVIKISVKIPLTNCLKLEYTTLKLISAQTSIAVLRIHNLTPDGNISLKRIQFSHPNFSIEEFDISSTEKNNENNNKCVELCPMESRNVILKVIGGQDVSVPKELIWLEAKWQLTTTRENSLTVNGLCRIPVEDIQNILAMEENSLIFELKHKSRSNHDFNSNPCHLCSIELHVHSRTNAPINLQMEKNPNTPTIGPGVKTSGDEIFFVGQTSWMLNVSPMNTYKLEYKVAVTRPGIFNVAPTLNVSIADNTQRKCVLHSPLIVAQFP